MILQYRDTKLIYTSSGGTIQDTVESPYGLSKDTGERYIRMLSKSRKDETYL